MKDSLRVIVSQALSFGFQVLFLLMSARALGPEAQGLYGIARTCAYLTEALMWFGLTSGVTYLVASDFRRYHGPLFAIAAAYLVGLVLMVLPIVLWVLPSYGIAAATGVLVLAWVVTLTVNQLFLKVFIGQQRYSLYNGLYLLVSVAAFVPFLWLYHTDGMSLHGVILCNIFANSLGVVFSIVAHRSYLARLEIPSGSIRQRISVFFSVGSKGYVSSVAFLLLYRADFFIVGYFVPKSLGVYTVAVFIGEAVQKIPDWLGMMLVPKVSAGQDEDGRLTRRMLLLSCGFVAAISGSLGLATLVDFRYVELVLGSDYHGIELLVLALMPKAGLHCLIAVYGARLAGRAYTLYHPAAGSTALAVLVIADIALFQRLGISAAITGITTAYAVAALILAVGARRYTRQARYDASPECVKS